jgi:hypothetical protein
MEDAMDLVQAAKIIGYDYIPAPEQIRELIIRAAARVAELEAQLEAVNNRLKIATDYWVIEAQNVKYCEGRIQELEAALAAAQELAASYRSALMAAEAANDN